MSLILDLIGSDLTLVRLSNTVYTTVEHDSIRIWPDTNSYYRFSQGQGGGPLHWLITWRGLSFEEAKLFLEDYPEELDPLKKLDILSSSSKDLGQGLEPHHVYGNRIYHPYIEGRNISEETAKRYSLEVIQDSILIPINDSRGRCGAIIRNTQKEKKDKYRKYFLREAPLLWPYDDWQNAKSSDTVFVFEGAWSVMRFYQVLHDKGNYVFLALLGAVADYKLISYLNGLNVIFVLDNDDAGKGMGQKLYQFEQKKWSMFMPNVYPDEMTDEQIVKFIEKVESSVKNKILCGGLL